MGSSNLSFSFQANLDVTDSLPVSLWSWDENEAGTSADTFSKGSTDDEFFLERDTAALGGSADSPLFRFTKLAKTRSEQKVSRRSRKWWRQAVSYSVPLGLLLAVFLAHCFRLWTRLSSDVAPLDLPIDTLLNKFIDKFVTAKDPTCFTNHKSFTAESPEAKAASCSFQEWVKKAKWWRDTAKSGNSAADGSTSGAKESAAEAAGTPERWELLLLQGALICYDLPEIEENAGFSPYFALHHGRYVYKEEGGQLALSAAAPAGEEKKQILRRMQEALRANSAKLNLWVAEMQKELQELAASKAEQLRTFSTTAPREKAEQEIKELGQALAFYEKLRIYVEKREPPPPLADGAPAADYLKAVDFFVMRTSTDAANAFSCVTAGAEGNNKKPHTLFISSPNKYIPYWLPHLLLSRQKETSRNHVGLRLQVAAMGLPTFAAADRASSSEFVELLNRTLVHEEEKQQLELLGSDSLDRRRLQKHIQLNQMHTGLAAATAMIQFHKNALITAEERKSTSTEALAELRGAVAAAQKRQAAIALNWMNKAKKGELFLSKKDAEELALALQHVVNGALLSKTLTQAQQKSTLEAGDQRNLQTTAGLLAICQLKLAAAARGDLHNNGTLPAWFAHII